MTLGLSAVVVYLALCAALYLLQRKLIYFPQRQSPSASANMLALPVPDARLVITTRPRAGSKAVLYFGGNAEDVASSLPGMSAAFADRAVYLMNYRSFGGSSGQPSEAALVNDAVALYDKVRADHTDFTVVGRSLGSGVAIQLAKLRPVTRLVLVTPYFSLQDLAARRFPVFPVRFLLRDKFESWRYAAGLSTPTRLVVAEHDTVVPRASSEALLEHFQPGGAQLRVLAGTDHNSIGLHPDYTRLLSDGP
jgi:pimeloyl-ACP methyl ester carboxylesterase